MKQPSTGRGREQFAFLCCTFVPPSERKQRYAEALREYDDFLRIEELSEFSVTENALYAATSMIRSLDDDGQSHDIGEFMLAISEDGVKWENLTQGKPKLELWLAPCVSTGGICGADDILGRLNFALADGNLAVAVQEMVNAVKESRQGIKVWPKTKVAK